MQLLLVPISYLLDHHASFGDPFDFLWWLLSYVVKSHEGLMAEDDSAHNGRGIACHFAFARS